MNVYSVDQFISQSKDFKQSNQSGNNPNMQFYVQLKKFLKILRIKQDFFIELVIRKSTGVNYYASYVNKTHFNNCKQQQMITSAIYQNPKLAQCCSKKNFIFFFQKIMEIWQRSNQKTLRLDIKSKRQVFNHYSSHKKEFCHIYYDLLLRQSYQIIVLIQHASFFTNKRIQEFLPSNYKTHQQSCNQLNVISSFSLKLHQNIEKSLILDCKKKEHKFNAKRYFKNKQISIPKKHQTISLYFPQSSESPLPKLQSFNFCKKQSLNNTLRKKQKRNPMIERSLKKQNKTQSLYNVTSTRFIQKNSFKPSFLNSKRKNIYTQNSQNNKTGKLFFKEWENPKTLYKILDIKQLNVQNFIFHRIFQTENQKERNKAIKDTICNWRIQSQKLNQHRSTTKIN